MYTYQARNYFTGEVSEYTCENRSIACKNTYKRADSMARGNLWYEINEEGRNGVLLYEKLPNNQYRLVKMW